MLKIVDKATTFILTVAFSVAAVALIVVFVLWGIGFGVKLAYAQAITPPGTSNFNITLTESGKPGGREVKDVFQREPGDKECASCPPMTLAAACAGALRNWNALDDAEYAPGGRLDEAAKVGQERAREKLAERIEANPQAVQLSPVEQTRLVKLLSRVLLGLTLRQAIDVVSPNEPVPELK